MIVNDEDAYYNDYADVTRPSWNLFEKRSTKVQRSYLTSLSR